MVAATDAQRNFAASTINYFNIDLKGGAGDTIKALVKATQKTAATEIATAIKSAKETTAAQKKTAEDAAAAALKKVTGTDLPAVKTSLEAAQKAVADLTTKITDTSTAAEKIVSDTEKKAVTDKLNNAKTEVGKATTELAKIDLDAMVKLTGTALSNAMISAKQAIMAASEAINNDTNGAIKNLGLATEAAGKITTEGDGATTVNDKTAVTEALTAATTAGTAAKDAIGDGDGGAGLIKDATTAGTDYASYVSLQATADAMEVGNHPITDAANAYNKACGGKIADITKVDEAGVIACNTELLKGYGFINAILKNLPNKATDVLKVTDGAFNGYADTLTGDNLIAATKYALISSTVAGTGPFVKDEEVPEPKDYTNHAEHVKHTLLQLNTISYALLQGENCGSVNKADLSECYKVHATDLKGIYDVVNIDKMNIDVSANYPYGQVSEGSELPTIEM